jgi:hypothetical protein
MTIESLRTAIVRGRIEAPRLGASKSEAAVGGQATTAAVHSAGITDQRGRARWLAVDSIGHRSLRVPDSLIDLAGLRVGAEDFLAAVLSTAAQPIWVVDPDGLIRFARSTARDRRRRDARRRRAGIDGAPAAG